MNARMQRILILGIVAKNAALESTRPQTIKKQTAIGLPP